MDKVKLHSVSRNIVPKHILNNKFSVINQNTNARRNNTRTTYQSEKGLIVEVDGFGTYLRVNPTTYMKGHNLTQISRSELGEFINMLEEDIEVGSDTFKLTGFDFNQTLGTMHAVIRYMPIFRNLRRYSKNIPADGNGVTFSNRCKSFVVYDKIQEMKRRNVLIPEKYHENNLLRMELCVNSKMSQTNELKSITSLRSIVHPDNYLSIVDLWNDTYDRIDKQSIYKLQAIKRPSHMSHDDYVTAFYINEHGLEDFLNQLADERNSGRMTRSQIATRKRNALEIWTNLANTPNCTGWDLLQELNGLVDIAADTCRNSI